MKETTKQNVIVAACVAVFFVSFALLFNAVLVVEAERFNECIETTEYVQDCI